MRQISHDNGLNAQNDLARRVAEIKKQEPFRQITLVVDSNHQALQFRRQLVHSLARVGELPALVAFSAVTKIDLISTLARIAQIEWDPQEFKASKQSVLRDVLISNGDVFGNLAKHPESFATLSSYVDQFDWIELSDDLLRKLKAQGETLTTKVSLDLLEVAKDVQEQLRVSGKLSPASLVRLLAHSPSDTLLRQAKTILGHVFVVSSDYPTTLSGLISALLGPDSQEEILLKRGRPREQNTKVFSFPDPETEAKAVVRQIAERISKGGSIERFAVLYTDAKQYADILESELDQAQITWNGIATELAVLSLPATATKGYIEVMNSIFQSGTFTRSDLLSLLRVSSVTSSGERVNSGTLVRFLSKSGFFNEVSNWAPLLQAMVDQIPSIKKLLKELSEYDADQDEINDAQYDLSQAQTAATLSRLIDNLMSSAKRLEASTDNSELSNLIWQEVTEFFPQLESVKMPIDRLSFEKLSELFASQHSRLLASRSQVREAIDQVAQTVLLKLGQLKMQHGELARGIYVGPVTQNGALYFENLWIVGAGEGMLPQPVSEDPIFPDALKDLMNQVCRAKLKSIASRITEIESNFFAVSTGAKNLTISFPRGGALAKSEGMPSSWLPLLTGEKANTVPSALDYRLSETCAISQSDLDSKDRAALPEAEALSKELSAAIWFVSPEVSEFAGNLGGKVSAPLIDFETNPLSASSVEKFLKCGHNFFTTKVLGVSDMDESDSIEELRAIDFGKAVHKAFERLLKEHPNLSPSFGEPYSDTAVGKFKELFIEECDLIIARGQAGWAPLFDSKKQTFLNDLPRYFVYEHQSRTALYDRKAKGSDKYKNFRDSDVLRPQFAEYEFDKVGNGLLEIKVETDDYPTQTLKFKGLIDRVDVSADGYHVGVLDFKTGRKGSVQSDFAVQDLLYEAAIRSLTEFVDVEKVSSRYLFLHPEEKSAGLEDLRTHRNIGVFLDPNDGGLEGQPYLEAIEANKQATDGELEKKLQLLVEAAFRGLFLTHDSDSSAASFRYCQTCKKLGQKTIERLSDIAHPGGTADVVENEEGSEQ
jgi:hypothetical protein